MNTRYITDIIELDKELRPRTPAEREDLAVWCAMCERSPEDVQNLKANQFWRTKTTELRGFHFCAECDQIIGTQCCTECGQPLAGILPTGFELAFEPNEKGIFLANSMRAFLRGDPDPKLVLTAGQSLNKISDGPLLSPIQVEMIFNEVGRAELLRRGA